MSDPDEPSLEAMDRALLRRNRARSAAPAPGRHLIWPAQIIGRAHQLQGHSPDFGVSAPATAPLSAPQMEWASDLPDEPPQRFATPRDEAIGSGDDGLGHQARAVTRTASNWDRLDDEPPAVANAAVTAFLSSMLKLPARKVEIHNGPAADAVAQSYAADAVTRDGRVAFRSGAFDPAHPRGAALFAHELSHATHRDAPGEREETRASSEEAVVLNFLARTTAARAPAAIVTPDVPAVLARTGQVPRMASGGPIEGAAPPAVVQVPASRAATDRAQPEMPASAPVVTEGQLEAIKQAVYREILDRIRSDFERGG